jgi:N-acetylneuraminic acid mutarotase
MNTARGQLVAVLLPNGKVLVAGGYNLSDHFLNSAELYDPATNNWSATRLLITPRNDHTATLLPGGRVLVVGGYGFTGDLISAELYQVTGIVPVMLLLGD